MTDHPITPPPELVGQWMRVNNMDIAPFHLAQALAAQAARWGADTELEACCEWLVGDRLSVTASRLRAARRPQTPSLKEQALEALMKADGADHPIPVLVLPIDSAAVIRRALEQLDD